MSILCKYVSNSGQGTERFWSILTERFYTLQTDLSLRDFMMICNAFKRANKIDETAFVKHANKKLIRDDSTPQSEFDWQIMSLLLSTLNLIADEKLISSEAYATLW